MSFRFIDPGFGISDYFGDGVDSKFYPPLKCLQSYTFNPRHGVAFYTDFSNDDGHSRIILGSESISDFYMKFDEYFPATVNGSAQTIVLNGSNFVLSIIQSGVNFTIRALDDPLLELDSTAGDNTHLNADAVNTIWLHVETTDEAWRVTLVINGEDTLREQDAWGYAAAASPVFRFYIPEVLPVSNLIIADEEISLHETIVEVGSSAADATMAVNDGVYSGVIAGEYVLQTPDASSLFDQFTPNNKVTAALAVAAPAYSDSDILRALKCRVVENGAALDFERMSLQEADETQTELDLPLAAQQIVTASDMTLAKLSELKIGWVVRL